MMIAEILISKIRDHTMKIIKETTIRMESTLMIMKRNSIAIDHPVSTRKIGKVTMIKSMATTTEDLTSITAAVTTTTTTTTIIITIIATISKLTRKTSNLTKMRIKYSTVLLM